MKQDRNICLHVRTVITSICFANLNKNLRNKFAIVWYGLCTFSYSFARHINLKFESDLCFLRISDCASNERDCFFSRYDWSASLNLFFQAVGSQACFKAASIMAPEISFGLLRIKLLFKTKSTYRVIGWTELSLIYASSDFIYKFSLCLYNVKSIYHLILFLFCCFENKQI